MGKGLIFPLAVLTIFVIYFAVAPKVPSANEIRVTRAMALEIASEREAVIGRQPNLKELEVLVRAYAEEEMMIFEADARGIEHQGCPSRKHLINRLLFVLDDAPRVPTRDDLLVFLAENQELYQVPERVSFEQVFFPTEEPAKVTQVLEELRSGADRKNYGKRYWTGNEIANITRLEIETSMGKEFAENVISAHANEWVGPFESSRGIHLIRVTGRLDARPAKFEEVRIQLEHDWDRQRRLTARERLVGKFKDSYAVTIDSLDGIL